LDDDASDGGECGAAAAQALSSVGLLSLIGFVNAVVGKQAKIARSFYHAESGLGGSEHLPRSCAAHERERRNRVALNQSLERRALDC
jgi:hypothetical protein